MTRLARAVVVVAAVAAFAASCASSPPADRDGASEVADPGDPAADAPERDALAFRVRFVRPDRTAVVAPRVVTLARRESRVTACDAGSADVATDVDVVGAPGEECVKVVRASVAEGLVLHFVAVPDGARDVGLGFSLTARRGVGAVPRRRVQVAEPPAAGVEIALPRTEVVERVGARRVPLGRAVVLATLASAEGPVRVELTVEAVRARIAASDGPPADHASPALTALAVAATEHDRREETVTLDETPAVPAMYACAGAPPVGDARSGGVPVRSRSLTASPSAESLVTVVAPGVRVAHRLETAHVRGFARRGAFQDPDVATIVSGVSATVRPDGAWDVAYASPPTFVPRRADERWGVPFDADLPLAVSASDLVPDAWTRSGLAALRPRTADGRGAVLRVTANE